MKKFTLEVDAYKTEKKVRKDYGYIPDEYEEDRSVSPNEIYEAITKFLQVNGFYVSCVKVIDTDRDVDDDPKQIG